MAQILIRQLDDEVKRKLQRRAEAHGRSTEAEARDILRAAVRSDEVRTGRLGSRIAGRFADVGLDADIVERRGSSATPAFFEP